MLTSVELSTSVFRSGIQRSFCASDRPGGCWGAAADSSRWTSVFRPEFTTRGRKLRGGSAWQGRAQSRIAARHHRHETRPSTTRRVLRPEYCGKEFLPPATDSNMPRWSRELATAWSGRRVAAGSVLRKMRNRSIIRETWSRWLDTVPILTPSRHRRKHSPVNAAMPGLLQPARSSALGDPV